MSSPSPSAPDAVKKASIVTSFSVGEFMGSAGLRVPDTEVTNVKLIGQTASSAPVASSTID